MIWMLVRAIGIGLLFVSWLTRRMSGGMRATAGRMSFRQTKARVLESDTGSRFKDVAGVDEAAEELKEIVEFPKMPSKFRRLGGASPKRRPAWSASGTGKERCSPARWLGEAGVPFFSASPAPSSWRCFVRRRGGPVRDPVATRPAAKSPRDSIFIDELDAIGKSSNAGMFGGHDEREQVR